MPPAALNCLQQPPARMNYLRAMGKLWRAKAAIMLKFTPNILHFSKRLTCKERSEQERKGTEHLVQNHCDMLLQLQI